jgi:hypothetical protein
MTTNLEQANKDGLIIGLGHLKTVTRWDIDYLLLNAPDTFNLFVLALKALQEDPNWKTNPMSYFQIAGS